MVSSGGKNYNYLLDDDYKIKSLYIMLPKRSSHVKSYDDETKWMNSLIKNAGVLKIH